LQFWASRRIRALNEAPPPTFNVHLEPGGQELRVSASENVLAVALAAGLPLAHSCRGGRCASCKSTLLSGKIEYPAGTPPGITAAEIARGEVLLCQAQPRSDLRIEIRRVPVRTAPAVDAEVLAINALPLGALHLRLRMKGAALNARPGQFVDVRNHAGDSERLAVIGARVDELDLEIPDDGSVLRGWLAAEAALGTVLRLAGPFDRLR
jgi:CDP-4-dehydro-6-deoxyglucose reductase